VFAWQVWAGTAPLSDPLSGLLAAAALLAVAGNRPLALTLALGLGLLTRSTALALFPLLAATGRGRWREWAVCLVGLGALFSFWQSLRLPELLPAALDAPDPGWGAWAVAWPPLLLTALAAPLLVWNWRRLPVMARVLAVGAPLLWTVGTLQSVSPLFGGPPPPLPPLAALLAAVAWPRSAPAPQGPPGGADRANRQPE
jgi:hypothetical protein